MSGGGGPDVGFGGPGGGDGVTPCDALTFSDRLQSADPAVVATLTVGQTLDVERQGYGVITVAPAGRAGVLHNQLTRMLQCLQEGYIFKADVQSITGIEVRMHVRVLEPPPHQRQPGIPHSWG
jgi:hypothetical protein